MATTKPAVRSFPEVYAAVANDLMTRLGDAVAAQAGPPTSEPVVPATNDLAVDAWNARNPAATDEAMLQLARQKYQEHVASGMPADVAQRATAEDLTHFRYGQRLKLYTHGQVGYAEQVAEAKRLAKLAAREATPNPPTPPPSMPSAVLTNLQSTPGLAERLGVPQPPGVARAPVQELPKNAVAPQGPPDVPTNGTPGAAPPPPPTPGGY